MSIYCIFLTLKSTQVYYHPCDCLHSILRANLQFKIEEGPLLEGGFKKKYLMQGLPQNGKVVFRGELEPRTKLWYNIITEALREISKIFISQNCNLQSRQVD